VRKCSSIARPRARSCLFSAFAEPHLPVVEQRHNGHTANNVAQRRRKQPLLVVDDVNVPGHHAREDLTAAGDAMRKMPCSHNECKQPCHGNLADSPVAR